MKNKNIPNNNGLFISLWIIIIGTIFCINIYFATTDKSKEFRKALIDDNKATYLCDKYGVVTFHITDPEMAATREILKDDN